jgi:3-oxoacid CoA-transferase subunit A
MIYYTGDTHGNFLKIENALRNGWIEKGDTVVILGDVGINYYGNPRDKKTKHRVSELGVTLFCIHGNHEMRPETIPSYKLKEWNGGAVYFEEKYPDILFAVDGEIYDLDGRKTLVIGGAYSVDKHYRIKRGWNWFADEQPSEETKKFVEKTLQSVDYKIDQILSHTCPSKYTPTEKFLPQVDQTTVDSSTEIWLDSIEDRTKYKRWLCGHWHIDKSIDKMRFVMDDIIV